MKPYTLYDDQTGEILQTGFVASDEDFELQKRLGAALIVGTADLDLEYVDIPTGTIEKKPDRPSEYHVFDWQTKTWVGDVAKLKAMKHAQIEAERDRQLSDPVIVYDGMRLDATAGSKQNLQDKITATSGRLGRGTPTPPQMLVWRDADNVVHGFANLQVYKDWLDGFAIALENRGMQAWAWSWQKKDELDTLTSFDDIYAFDPFAEGSTVPPRR